MTNVAKEEIRQIVREELRRDRIGARCPECGEPSLGITLEEIELEAREEEPLIYNCPSCEFGGPIGAFDPQNQ